ncbi:hypothetical protein KCP77_04860 [Salmonella enterica subsp. enterica]|nr:hypothetical protein KCP77_04860 [Salmonella enterica subsp. enterica]
MRRTPSGKLAWRAGSGRVVAMDAREAMNGVTRVSTRSQIPWWMLGIPWRCWRTLQTSKSRAMPCRCRR